MWIYIPVLLRTTKLAQSSPLMTLCFSHYPIDNWVIMAINQLWTWMSIQQGGPSKCIATLELVSPQWIIFVSWADSLLLKDIDHHRIGPTESILSFGVPPAGHLSRKWGNIGSMGWKRGQNCQDRQEMSEPLIHHDTTSWTSLIVLDRSGCIQGPNIPLPTPPSKQNMCSNWLWCWWWPFLTWASSCNIINRDHRHTFAVLDCLHCLLKKSWNQRFSQKMSECFKVHLLLVYLWERNTALE